MYVECFKFSASVYGVNRGRVGVMVERYHRRSIARELDSPHWTSEGLQHDLHAFSNSCGITAHYGTGPTQFQFWKDRGQEFQHYLGYFLIQLYLKF